MPEIKNNFLQGKMNKDLDDRLLPNGQYRDAFNIKVSKSDNSDVGTVQNIKSNDRDHPSLTLASTIKTIGKYVDPLNGDCFWFVTDFEGVEEDDPTVITNRYAGSSKKCRIYYTQLGSNNTPKALINDYRLNFSTKHPILHVNKIDDLLFWTDNYNQPRRIDIKLAKSSFDASLNSNTGGSSIYQGEYLEDLISVAQYSPPSAAKVTLSAQATSTVKSLHLKDKFVKFAYRFQYANNEFSIISPFTQTCFCPGYGQSQLPYGEYQSSDGGVIQSEPNIIDSTIVAEMQNMVNRVELFIDLPSNTDEDSHASCDVVAGVTGGVSGAGPHSIDTKHGTIADGNVILTERGDKYIAAIGSDSGDGNGTTTVGTTTSIDAKTPLIDNQRLYFFTTSQAAAYTNHLKIKKIQILYSESDSLALKVVDTLNFSDVTTIHRAEPISTNVAKLIHGFKFTYDSTKPVQTLPEADLIRVADIAPVKAKTQEVSGNRVIYGNFYQNRSISDLTLTKDQFTVTHGDQSNWNDQYLNSSVKSNREYSVGLVLSDRYGRHSTVFLPTDNTEFVDPKTGSVNGWDLYALKLNFSSVIGDAYAKDTNPLGWYSYKVVVKQAEQEFYNVYAPTLVDNIPSTEKRSWLVLTGDNINKVPRDVTDINTEDGTVGSQTSLLPKILDTTGAQAQQSGNDFIDIISIGTKHEHGLEAFNEFYQSNKNPLLAELPDGSGRNRVANSTFNNLVVLETKPISSALDIYYETSTAGLISHLNAAIEASLGTVPNGITLSTSSRAENVNFSSTSKVADLTTTDTGGGNVSSPTYQILSITDGNGTDRSGAFVINGEDLDAAENFEFRNNASDNYTIRIKSTDSSNNSTTQDKSVSITNVAPTISVGSALTGGNSLAASTTVGTAIRTVTAVNGTAKSGATTNDLTYSITAGNTDSDFTIGSSTGIITTVNSLTSGDTYTLTIKVTDIGGLTDTATLSIAVASTNYQHFYISETTQGGGSASAACSLAVGSDAYFIPTSSETTPDDGKTIYTDQAGTVLNGQGNWFSFFPTPHDGVPGSSGSNTSFRGQISSSGVLSNKAIC
jgi:hypothetical protein|tara:strand:- start:6905 stop:10129 length:3225 start_codon:yes stop_codon:yes gene_type:complete